MLKGGLEAFVLLMLSDMQHSACSAIDNLLHPAQGHNGDKDKRTNIVVEMEPIATKRWTRT